jgi:hypothetical protein
MLVSLWYGLSKIILRVFFGARFGLEIRGQEHVPKRGPLSSPATTSASSIRR